MAFTSSESNDSEMASNSSESSGWMYEAAAIAAYAMLDSRISSSEKKPRIGYLHLKRSQEKCQKNQVINLFRGNLVMKRAAIPCSE
jgi:hypothetical protein